MQLKVNGQDVDITLENEKTIGDVLASFEAEAEKNNATTVSIKIDGTPVSAEEFDEAAKNPIKEDTLIELRVISLAEIRDALSASQNNLKSLSEQLLEIPAKLQSGDDKYADQIITNLADGIDSFCHTTTLCALFPEEYEKIKFDGKSAGEFFEDFAPIIADLEQAMSSKDTVTIGDLCEYEISPRLMSLAESISKYLGA